LRIGLGKKAVTARFHQARSASSSASMAALLRGWAASSCFLDTENNTANSHRWQVRALQARKAQGDALY